MRNDEVFCPYCNGAMVLEYEEDVYWYECTQCNSRSPNKFGENGLIDKALKRYQKHARWLFIPGCAPEFFNQHVCSLCKTPALHNPFFNRERLTPWCPECGAVMDKE